MVHYCNIFHIDHHDSICLDLLSRFLFPHGLGKDVVFIKKIEVLTYLNVSFHGK